MNLQDIEQAVKKVMGENPDDMVVRYYESLIELNRETIADCEKKISELEHRIKEVKGF